MCMSRSRIAAACAAVAWISAAVAQEGPNLGVAATPEEIAGWDISVAPDGDGLPQGSGTPSAGAAVFAVKCAACHGPQGEGLLNDRLAGGQGSLTSDRAVKTIGSYWPYATTVWDYVYRAMPFGEAQTLTPDEVYAITAFLLSSNDLFEWDVELNQDNLAAIALPNCDRPAHDKRLDRDPRRSGPPRVWLTPDL